MKPRLMLAATKSGSGKTTISTAIMAALKARGMVVQGFKVGPDYIDPSYHQAATGRISANLDVWLTGEKLIQKIFTERMADADIGIIEGVMGLFDGSFQDGSGSSAALAKLLHTPVILVLDCQSMGQSAAAHVLGFKLFDPQLNLAGVILNRLASSRHGEVLKAEIQRATGLPVLGMIYRDAGLQLSSRHLGLVPAGERESQFSFDCKQIEKMLQLNQLVAIAKETHSEKLSCSLVQQQVSNEVKNGKTTWAVARDEAFSFVYADALELLKGDGYCFLPFSPLHDRYLPKGCQGLILGGGFPEIFARELAANQEMLAEIRAFAKAGLPIYAECGGMMYLSQGITLVGGEVHTMAGVVPAQTVMGSKLAAMGYVTAINNKLILNPELALDDESLHGHVFHYSHLQPLIENFPYAWQLQFTRGNKKVPDGYAWNNIFASYVHLHYQGIKRVLDYLKRSEVVH